MVRKITKIYIGNLPESCQNKDMQQLFEKYGKVEECDVIKNYGFVHMSSEEEAKSAIEALNNTEFMGSKITVEVSHSKVRPKPGMGGKGQCYRCGRQGHWSKECPRNPNARMGNMPPPMTPPFPYSDRPMPRYGLDRGYAPADRGFAPERGFGADRNYAGERMRPYPDPYDRRPPPPLSPGLRDDYYCYRRTYDEYGFDRYNYADDRDMVAPQGMTAASQYASGTQDLRRDQYDSFAGMTSGQYNSRPDQFTNFPRGIAASQTDASRMTQYDTTTGMMDSSFTSRPDMRRDVEGFNTMTTQQYNTGGYDIKQDPYGNVSSMMTTTPGDSTRDVSTYGGVSGSTLLDVKRDYVDQFSGMATAVVAAARETTNYAGMSASYGLSTTQSADTKRDYRDTMGVTGFIDRTQEVTNYSNLTTQYGSMPVDVKRDYSNTFATTAASITTPQQTTQGSYRMGREGYEQLERMNAQYSNGSANLWREQYARLTGSMI
ncbi:uncharacterized protein [Centruroides vittatus]|uniref:uncharacterized protein isoform X2 n=1 Tax=Centruroides vittatus TaxID=120091 RepID=UPI0035101DAC